MFCGTLVWCCYLKEWIAWCNTCIAAQHSNWKKDIHCHAFMKPLADYSSACNAAPCVSLRWMSAFVWYSKCNNLFYSIYSFIHSFSAFNHTESYSSRRHKKFWAVPRGRLVQHSRAQRYRHSSFQRLLACSTVVHFYILWIQSYPISLTHSLSLSSDSLFLFLLSTPSLQNCIIDQTFLVLILLLL